MAINLRRWLVVAVLVCVGGRASAFEINKCDSTAEGNVRKAARFIDDNLTALVATFSHLSQKQRDEFTAKWPKVKIVCKDNANHCVNKPSVGGYAHGGVGNHIRACYYHMVDFNLSLCDLVDDLVHEMGHANGYPHMPGHNNPDANVRANDNMYVMGSKALSFCLSKAASGAFVNASLTGTTQRAVGDECSRDDQCKSGRCEGTECGCKADSDCPTGEACYKPVGKQTFCESTSIALDGACNRDSQCRSGKCEGGMCVCRTDGDCPAGQKCYTPVTGKNHCEQTSRALGESCSKDSECKSEKCQSGSCVCKSDSDCAAGEKCFTPVGGKNHCEATSKAVGASCGKDSECKSGKCEKDKCVCNKDSDCPVGMNCKRPIGKSNFCQ